MHSPNKNYFAIYSITFCATSARQMFVGFDTMSYLTRSEAPSSPFTSLIDVIALSMLPCFCIVDFVHARPHFYPWHFDVKATMAELTIEWDAYGFHIAFTAFASDSNGSNSKWRKEIRIVRLLPAKRAHRIPSIRRKWGQEWARTLFIVFSVWLNALWSFLADFPPHRLYSFHWIVCELNGSAKLLIRVYFSIQTNAFVLLYNVMENCGLWMCSGSFSFTTTWSFRSSQNDNHLQFKNTVDWMPNLQPYVRLKKDAGAHSMAHNTSSHTCRCV